MMSHANNHRQLAELIDALCEGEISRSQLAQLEQLLRDDPQARNFYIDHMQLVADFEWHRAADDAPPPPAGDSTPGTEPRTTSKPAETGSPRTPILGMFGSLLPDVTRLNRAFEIAPAMLMGLLLIGVGILIGAKAFRNERAVPVVMDTPPIDQPTTSPIQDEPRQEPQPKQHVAIQEESQQQPQSKQPVAILVTAVDCRWENGALPTEPGSRLSPGRLCLIQGIARIDFNQGAQVTLEGPAVLELRTAGYALLEVGKLVARVPKQAIGFTIQTPMAKVVDLGTEFGVEVEPSGISEVHVFAGVVELSSLADGTRHPAGTLIRAGQAKRLEATHTEAWHKVAVGANRFVRSSLSRRVFSTGVDEDARPLKPGVPDPHWTLTECPDVGFSAKGAAITAYHVHDWIPNGRGSQWISLSAKGSDSWPPGRYTYRTTFELTETESSTVQIVGRFCVDNQVTDVLLNGTSTRVSGDSYVRFTSFVIDQGFIKGTNQLEFHVLAEGPQSNPHGLRVELELVASPGR